MFHQPAAFPNMLTRFLKHTHTQSLKNMKIENTKMKRHHPSEQQEQAFSDDPCIQTCDCPLKSEYDSSHDSSDDSFHFEYESFSKRSKFCNGQDEVAVKVELKTEQLKMENDADDYDDDSLNNNLRGEVDADGMYAFCCCNCR